MPTYEYQCKSCGTHLDVVQKFGDDPLTECPSCGGPLRKVFGAVGVVFKGSGFYKTDSRTSSKKSERSDKAEKSDTKAPASSDKAGSASSDSSGSKSPGSDSSGSKSSDSSGSSSSPKSGASTTTGSAAAAFLTRPRLPSRRSTTIVVDLRTAERHPVDGQGLAGGDTGKPFDVRADVEHRLEHLLEG